jgi:hypothetical protein
MCFARFRRQQPPDEPTNHRRSADYRDPACSLQCLDTFEPGSVITLMEPLSVVHYLYIALIAPQEVGFAAVRHSQPESEAPMKPPQS